MSTRAGIWIQAYQLGTVPSFLSNFFFKLKFIEIRSSECLPLLPYWSPLRMWICTHSTFRNPEGSYTPEPEKTRTSFPISLFLSSWFTSWSFYHIQFHCALWTSVWQAADRQILLTWYSCLHPRWDVCPFSMCLQFGCINGSQQFDHFLHHLVIKTHSKTCLGLTDAAVLWLILGFVYSSLFLWQKLCPTSDSHEQKWG